MNINENDFKHCLGCFATGVTVATTNTKEGLPKG